MAVSKTVADPANPVAVAAVALRALVEVIDNSCAGSYDGVEVYLNIFPANSVQFNEIFDACDEAGIELELDVRDGRVRLMCGPRPGAPVTVWGDDPTTS